MNCEKTLSMDLKEKINEWFKTGFPELRDLENSGFGENLSFKNLCSRTLDHYFLRDFTINNYGFGFPINKESLDIISNLSNRILEIGAGSGWLSFLLSKNIDIIATDIKSVWKNSETNLPINYFAIEEMDAVSAVEKYPDRDILTCWPTYEKPWAFESVNKIRSDQILFYIGEGYGGCTADDSFHDLLDREFDLINKLNYPNWPGIHDRLFIYRRK